MAKRTLLQMIQNVTAELGLPIPQAVIGSQDAQVLQLLALANREGRELSEKDGPNDGWQQLRKEYTFSLVATSGLTANYSSGSAVITNIQPNTSQIQVGMVVSSTNMPLYATVLSVDSASQVTLSAPATASATNTPISFGVQSYQLPSDFGYFIPQTGWDRSFRWQLMGPMEPQEWQVLKSGLSPVGPRIRFRIMNNLIYFDPIPYSQDAIVFEYYSNAWCQSSGGTPQTQWTADTDTYLLPDSTMELGIKWRFLYAKGLEWGPTRKEYDEIVDRKFAHSGSARTLPLNARSNGLRLLSNTNVPDTGFGS